ncbi:MAG TPA: ABC transporter ATP-binding protein [Planctomycetota bacterium]|nr:ABC transporter ATP-binding protein [Planctomycetota bacterium]
MGIIEMHGVTKRYSRGGETLTVLDRLDLVVPEGDFVALMGPSGSGKSTILNLVGGLDAADEGSISVAGLEITSLASSELPHFRARHIGFIFQAFNLVPVLTAWENVMLPLLLTPLDKAGRRKQAEFALEVVGLQDRMHHRPRQLSGGQEQRVAIARALATDPDIILADEPTGDLDRDSANAIMDLLRRLNVELKKTLLVVTHDHVAAERARRVLHLDKGVLAREVRNEAAPLAAPGTAGARGAAPAGGSASGGSGAGPRR